MATGTHAAVMAACMMFLAQSDAKKQAIAAVGISALLGSLAAGVTFPVKSSVWYFLGPAVVGAVGYLLAYANPAGLAIGFPAGPMGALAPCPAPGLRRRGNGGCDHRLPGRLPLAAPPARRRRGGLCDVSDARRSVTALIGSGADPTIRAHDRSHPPRRPWSPPPLLSPTPPAISAPYGGVFVPETLDLRPRATGSRIPPSAQADPSFKRDFDYYLREFVGRPSRLYFARRLTEHFGGAKIYLKREDLNHTGAHKINNTIGQALLTLRMGKKRVIAETGAGQHGVATATAAAAVRAQVRRLHGRRRHPPPEPQRLPHEAHGRQGDRSHQRQQDAQGRHQRSHARLDGLRRTHPLHHRHRSSARTRSR